jgi:hypothetical protein
MCVDLDPLAFILHFASQLCIASKLACSLLEAMAVSLSVAITAVSSAKFLVRLVGLSWQCKNKMALNS